MSAATAPLNRDVRVISLIGVAHGVSHYYQLAFATMLLIVRQEAGLSFTDVGLLAGVFYGVSGISQTAAGFAVDRFGARPILAGGLATAVIQARAAGEDIDGALLVTDVAAWAHSASG